MKVITKLSLGVMEEMSKDLTRKWSINEISKKLNKHYRPVHAAAQSLLKQGFLIKNKNKLVEPSLSNNILLELAEKQRLTNHNKEIRIMSDKLSKMNTVFFSAILFGSSVHKKGNDIDILIIVPDSGEIQAFQRYVEVALGSFYSKVDLNIISEANCYEMLNKPNQLNVMNEILKKHLVLYGEQNFYNLLKRWKND